MLRVRPDTADRLEFVQVGDLGAPGGFDEAVKGVNGIVHCAAPVSTNFENGEKDAIIPAIEGNKAIISAAAKEPKVKRIVFTSSFAAVIDVSHVSDPTFTFVAEHWNPITYEEAAACNDIRAYRGAKKFSELYAWDYVRDHEPHFDIAVIIPPMVFGPIVHPIAKITDLNVSSMYLWVIADGQDYPEQRGPIWVDVRDLAFAHAEALLRPEASNRRFLISAPEQYSFQRAADVIRQEFNWAKDVVKKGNEGEPLPNGVKADGETAGKALGIHYRPFKESVVDAITQFKQIAERG